MRFSTIFTALFYTYIAHERTAQNLDFVSLLVALILIERHRSQNKGSLKSEERLSDFKERCAQLNTLFLPNFFSSYFPPKVSAVMEKKTVYLKRQIGGFFCVSQRPLIT